MIFILASASPRRQQLLSSLGYEFQVIPSMIDEEIDVIHAPDILAMMLARTKAEAVFCGLAPNVRDEAIVLGADTVVATKDGKILGKPKNKEEAIQMLMGLKNCEHEVVTGICLHTNSRVVCSLDKSSVTFLDFGLDDIIGYINDGKSYDKAGGYGIQDEEIGRITKSVLGSQNNIIGLPTELLEKILGAHF